MAGNETITFSKDHIYGIFIVALVALLALSVFTSGFGIMPAKSGNTSTGTCTGTSGSTGTGSTGGTGSTAGTGSGDPLAGINTLTVSPGDSPIDGQASAPVTWVEFSDFQCPYCSRLYLQTDNLIKSNYVVTGKVQMYFRYFPLSFHDKANVAALAAACANAQGKFWEMHNKLFTDQTAWSSLSASEAPATFEGYATGLGLDGTKFASCMSANTYATQIAADETEGQSYGVQGTPGVFVILPKAKTDIATLKTVVGSYGDGMTLFQDSDHITVFVAGAYPYSAFSAILNTVTY